MIRLDELPNAQRRAIDLVREVATEKQFRPFLVGGPVRDLLLGRHDVVDVDITLEHDSSPFARALAKHIGGRVRSFPQFLTYKVTADGLPDIDIATARTEKYRKPGALPSVAPGRLSDDLLRRDFSINAIAVDILGGAIHDPATVHAMLEDYRAGLGIDTEHDAADRAAGRRIACPTLVLWSERDDMEELYGDPIAIWSAWCDDVRAETIDAGHHVAEEAPEALAATLLRFLGEG